MTFSVATTVYQIDFDEESFLHTLRMPEERKFFLREVCANLAFQLQNIAISVNTEYQYEGQEIERIKVSRQQAHVLFQSIDQHNQATATTRIPVSFFHRFAKEAKLTYENVYWATKDRTGMSEIFHDEIRETFHWAYCRRLEDYFQKGEVILRPTEEYDKTAERDPQKDFWRRMVELLANYTFPDQMAADGIGRLTP